MYKKSTKWSALSFVLCFVLTLTVLSSTAFAGTVQASEASQVTRLSGTDRYKTAVEISKSGWDKSQYAVVVRGDDFADALSAGPLAKKYNAPVLLTETNNLSNDILNELKRLEVENVIIVGGPGAVSTAVENKIATLTVNNKAVAVERIQGIDRFETSVKVAQRLGTASDVVLATGYNYPDALSIAPIAASKGMPILLTQNSVLPDSVKAYLDTNKNNIEKTYIVGGTGVIGSNVESLVVNPKRLGGADRFGTNIAVMNEFINDLDFEDIFVAVGDGTQGDEFADALSGAALAAKTASPVVLMYKTVPVTTEAFLALTSSDKAKVVALGGAAVVPDNAVNSLVTVIKTPLIASNLGGTAVRGVEKSFQVATAAKDALDEMVRVRVTLTNGKDNASISYKEVNDGQYYPLSFDESGVAWYGPETGFPLTDAVSDFKVTFNNTDSVSYKLEVVKVSDETVLTGFAGKVDVSAQSLTGDDAKAFVVPENFNTNLSDLYVGYNVGWNLTDSLNLSDVAKIEVSLLDDKDNVLVTNVSTDKLLALDTKELSTAFNVDKNIKYSDEYWTLGTWVNGTKLPSKAEIKVTNKNGDTYTVVNDSLAVVAGDENVAKYLDTYVPKVLTGDDAEAYVVPENFNTHFNVSNSLDYVGYNVGWHLTDAVKLSEIAKMEVSLLDDKGNVLVTNTSTDKILGLDTLEFSTPFNVNFHVPYADEYWTFGKWAGKTQQPSKAQIKITTVYGDTYTVVNNSLAVVAGTEEVANYLGD